MFSRPLPRKQGKSFFRVSSTRGNTVYPNDGPELFCSQPFILLKPIRLLTGKTLSKTTGTCHPIFSVFATEGKGTMTEGGDTTTQLQEHVRTLTETIGERSIHFPRKLEKAASYIESIYRDAGLKVHRETYPYRDFTVANVVAEISFYENPTRHYLLGAHYESVAGTVGADDNASAVAVQLEAARALKSLEGREDLDLTVRFVSFTLGEPPAFNTPYRGSKVYARQARKKKSETPCHQTARSPERTACAVRKTQRSCLLLGSGLPCGDGHGFRILPQSILPPALRHHGKTGLPIHERGDEQPAALLQIPPPPAGSISPDLKIADTSP